MSSSSKDRPELVVPIGPVQLGSRYQARAEYDLDKGELTIVDQYTREVVRVRDGFVEAATTRAAILELERLGYTVIDPGIVPPCLNGCGPNWTRHHPGCPNDRQEPTE